MDKKTESLIINYFANRLSDEEVKDLRTWLEISNNKSVFKKYIELNYTIEESKSKLEDTSKLWEDISSLSYKKSKSTYLKYWKYAVAASLVIFLSLGVIVSKFNVFSSTEGFSSSSKIEPGTDRAILTLENGEEIELKSGHSYATTNAEGDESGLIYLSKTSDASNNDTIQPYNYITVPRGGQYYVELSDGTKVWLNSESQLKYPINFVKGKLREVELVYGEAYFDVSPSTNHKGSKFKVLTSIQEIEVLGTKFNVSAYKGQDTTYSTLVEGKVAVSKGNRSVVLEPEQQSIISNKMGAIKIVRVDVYSVTSWKNGVFSFENMPLEKIMKVLARWYDVDVVFVNSEIKDVNFTGVFRKNQNIEDILTAIKNINGIAYEINKGTIIFK